MPTTNDPADGAKQIPSGTPIGEYVVERQIGAGGFGTVYLAEHPLIGKQVAIKVLAPKFSADPEMVSRFVAEARAVNQIRHRNIIDIFSFGKLDDGRHYYIMEYLAGRPLDEYLEERGALPLEEAIPILRAIAKALDAAHAKGIAHRDLKPENVFLVEADGDAPFPKLLDFGIAKLLHEDETTSHKTRTGAPIGTPAYMSPEQCRGRNVDHRTDIYAFGILTYLMLTGELPFDGEDYMEVLLKQIGEQPRPPSQTQTLLAASVDAAVLLMLEKDPADRPPSLLTAVDELAAVARDLGVAVPVSRVTSVNSATATPTGLRGTDDTVMAADSLPTNTPESPPPGERGRQAAIAVALVSLALLATVVAFWLLRGPGQSAIATPIVDQVAAKAAAKVVPVVDAGATIKLAPAPPALPTIVDIRLVGAPDGTEVFGPRGIIGVVPARIQIAHGREPVVLTLRADGYRSASLEVVPDGSKEVEVTLVKTPSAKPTRKRRSKKKSNRKSHGRTHKLLENPF